MKLDQVLQIIANVPDYQFFHTVDELNNNTRDLAHTYPDLVTILPLGKSQAGDPIDVIKIGSGSKTALIFAMPHPNEPIGSMMVDYFSERLAAYDELRNSLDFTWYLIKCVDPDGMRLNEGWFKGPFTITNYARDFYRPPSHLQVEWTFPINYKDMEFDSPLPETQALMTLIEQIKPDLIYSLHNAGFGGAYFYISDDLDSLWPKLYELVKSQGLPLHLGEAEAPWMNQFAEAIFETPSITQAYDFIEEQGADPTKALTGGTCSWDYAKLFSDPLSLLCELPYFNNDLIHDTSLTDVSRRSVILAGYEKIKEQFQIIESIYRSAEQELTVDSPFKDAIASLVQAIPQNIQAMTNWAGSDPKTEDLATNAEKFDSLFVKRFYYVFLNMGMTIRMLETQISASGVSPTLSSALTEANKSFEEISSDLEKAMAYSVIPIQKLVRVQLGSILLASSYVAQR